ncbi:glycosyltransferase [Albibacterium bauzanense]|uniref:GT2 family glycosyltransferase n=1 Tax=Albibacterium bauzanense TaxID=653929 RepID=A0A4R1M733_9SPHI|nr:glycosyltransferase [Albibacterium bauzanense]TCK85629.1 GT2 family glycosyltransferase [Albibacterium bauzanense]
MDQITISLIISVYKNIKDLKVILDNLHYQTHLPDEIIISEDGNSSEMKLFIENYSIDIPLVHLSQEDKGWQKNKALNNAIIKAKYEYLIFIDGDCVLHTKFIQNHLLLSNPQHILAGKRVKLGPTYSEKLSNIKLPEFQKKIIPEARKLLKDNATFYEEAIYIPLNPLTKIIIQKLGISSIKGCNFSCYKTAILAINGFDEDYIKPAIGEDHDLVWRFEGLGYKIVSIKHFAVQYHLYHKENWSSQEENLILLKQKQKAKTFICLNGIKKTHS